MRSADISRHADASRMHAMSLIGLYVMCGRAVPGMHAPMHSCAAHWTNARRCSLCWDLSISTNLRAWRHRSARTGRWCCTGHACARASPCCPSGTARRCASSTNLSSTSTAQPPPRAGAWRRWSSWRRLPEGWGVGFRLKHLPRLAGCAGRACSLHGTDDMQLWKP